ncbi:polyphosphate polymerase domain-containing protein [Sedimentibacter sp.]|uniref:polyphosphate polymerase domain-containing protein n=1 Tax=Sedimentibacter sp. TaxID=1960295 RepID=UPI00289DE4A0|nr:polyphosphate polymerase domain-containing protein [Sedimentibacter sp.]
MKGSQGRHELKHYISYADVLQLRARLPHVAGLDKNAIQGNGYRVKSLYFDNYNDKVLKEKIDGVNEREKFRLRLYNDNTSFIRLEKKSKKNGICFKESTVITEEECRRLLDGDIAVLKENGSALCMELYTKMHYQQLRAKNIVDYQRDAFIYPMGNARVTLDYDIRTSGNIYGFLNPEPVPIPVSGVYILEVKYDNFLPEIIRGMVSLYSRRSTAFSKYAVTRIF